MFSIPYKISNRSIAFRYTYECSSAYTNTSLTVAIEYGNCVALLQVHKLKLYINIKYINRGCYKVIQMVIHSLSVDNIFFLVFCSY